MLYRVTHSNTYTYSEPASLCQNLLHLIPRELPQQECMHSQVLIQPQPAVSTVRSDYFGNPVSFFAVQEPHLKLVVTASHLISVKSEPAPPVTPPWERVCEQLQQSKSREDLEACQFLFDSTYVSRDRELAEYARPSFPAGRP